MSLESFSAFLCCMFLIFPHRLSHAPLMAEPVSSCGLCVCCFLEEAPITSVSSRRLLLSSLPFREGRLSYTCPACSSQYRRLSVCIDPFLLERVLTYLLLHKIYSVSPRAQIKSALVVMIVI